MPELRALIVDFGGVLTSPLTDTLDAFCERLDLDREELGRAISQLLAESGAPASVHKLEMGEMSVAEFEGELALLMRSRSGTPIAAAGLLTEMFAGFGRDHAMNDAVRNARGHGIRTALLSNSWGTEGYPRHDFDELFDAVVISGEVGLRKPDVAIYSLAAQMLELEPAECVFVDDLAHNVRGAVKAGMVGVHHTDPAATLDELQVLFGVDLRA